MQPGFHDLPYAGTSVDGENWVATKSPIYVSRDGKSYRLRVGAATDGPSIPHAAESVVQRTGPQWLPGVFHDAGYRQTLEVLCPDGQWRLACLTKEECDLMFKEALELQGCPPAVVKLLYESVEHFGGEAFVADRSG